MINAVPEAEAPEIGIREHWETWKGKEEGGILSLFRELASEGLINLKITCAYLLSTLQTTSSFCWKR